MGKITIECTPFSTSDKNPTPPRQTLEVPDLDTFSVILPRIETIGGIYHVRLIVTEPDGKRTAFTVEKK